MVTAAGPWARAAALCALAGAGAGVWAWCLGQVPQAPLWPELSLTAWVLGGALAYVALGAGLTATLVWALDRDAARSRSLAWQSLLPGVLGLAASWVQRLHLPPPHDLPARALEIWAAALLLAGLYRLVLGVLLGLHHDGDASRRPAWTAWRLFGLAWVAYMAAGVWVSQWTCTGDAPHYLVMTQALAERGSFDVAPEHQARRWRAYYDRDDLISYGLPMPGGSFPMHRPGLALLLAPGWRVLGPWGARWAYAGIAAAAAALLFWLLIGLGLEAPAALAGHALLAYTAPWLIHAATTFPDLAAGALWCVVLAAWKRRAPAWSAWLAAGSLPWMHVRFLPLAAALALGNALLLPRRRWAGLALSAGLGIAMLAQMHAEFGVWSPQDLYHLIPGDVGVQFHARSALNALAGLLIDQEYGLLAWCPAFALAVAGAWRLARRDPRFSLCAGLALAAAVAPVLGFSGWHGTMAPARLLVPALPLLALLAAESMRPRLSAAQGALLGLSLAGGWLMAALPWFCFPKADGQNLLLRIAGGAAGGVLTRLGPSFIINSPTNPWWVLLTVAALAAAAWRWGRPSRP